MMLFLLLTLTVTPLAKEITLAETLEVVVTHPAGEKVDWDEVQDALLDSMEGQLHPPRVVAADVQGDRAIYTLDPQVPGKFKFAIGDNSFQLEVKPSPELTAPLQPMKPFPFQNPSLISLSEENRTLLGKANDNEAIWKRHLFPWKGVAATVAFFAAIGFFWKLIPRSRLKRPQTALQALQLLQKKPRDAAFVGDLADILRRFLAGKAPPVEIQELLRKGELAKFAKQPLPTKECEAWLLLARRFVLRPL